jgi:hypothetical protein
MLPKILPKDKFDAFIAFLMGTHRVVAPVARGPQFAFARIDGPEDIADIRMDYDLTILPPKKYLMPQHEALLEFAGPQPGQARPCMEAEPTVILGVHPYDLHGIATVDAAMTQAPADGNWMVRREATKLIGLNVSTPANEHQFQADMGTLEPPEGGFDLFLTDLGDRFFVEVGSPWGRAVANDCGCCALAGPDDHKAKHVYDRAKAANFVRKLPYDIRYLPEMMDSTYDSLLWDAVARRCFSCGTCTNVCPTCYCFDVQDKLNVDAASGVRQRSWDSCQLKVFAEVAGGENFREHRNSRLRHRMFRKAKFIRERTGKLGCVGCGRCSLHCVADISILETLQQIAGSAAEAGA